MSSPICLDLDQSKILWSGDGLSNLTSNFLIILPVLMIPKQSLIYGSLMQSSFIKPVQLFPDWYT